MLHNSWKTRAALTKRLAALAGAALLWTSAAAQEVIAFRNVAVIPMDTERVLAAQTVVVRGVVTGVDDGGPVLTERGGGARRAGTERHGRDVAGEGSRLREELQGRGSRPADGRLGEDPDRRHLRSPWPRRGRP